MLFAQMVAEHEDAIICDFSQYYHVFDIRSLPLRQAAVLACGLPAESRTMKNITGRKYSSNELLQIMLIDEIRDLQYLYVKSHAGKKKNIPRPKSLMNRLLGKELSTDVESYDSAEAYEAARKRIISR